MRLLFAVALLFGCVVLTACCENESVVEHSSPDANWKYVTFDRNCGATTGSNWQITVLPASKRLRRSAANAFIADDNHGAANFVPQAEWLPNRVLQIQYSSKARIFKKESHVGPIEVKYLER